MFLEATLTNGQVMISEFHKLTKVAQYIADVYAGRKPFNLWHVENTVHPASGEKVLMRSRGLVNGNMIVSIVEVKPLPGRNPGSYASGQFTPVVKPEQDTYRSGAWSGARTEKLGLWEAPSVNTPEGAHAGVEYPIHKGDGGRRYVILAVGYPDTLHYLDSETPAPDGDVPDDEDDEDFIGEGFDDVDRS